MKIRTFIITISILLMTQVSCGQKKQVLETLPEGKKPMTKAGQDDSALRRQSEEFVKAMMSNDITKIVDFTHPIAVLQSGGKDEMIEYLKKFPMNDPNIEGHVYESVEVVEIKPVVEAGGELYAVVPIRFNVKSPTGKKFAITSMVGVSNDNGANWKFLLGFNQSDFDASFPKAAGKIQIPADRESKVSEDE
jgi:hypothetical protein